MSHPYELDPGILARVDQLHATASQNLSYVLKAAQEAKRAGWDYPALAVLIGYKLDSDTPQLDRRDMALLVGAAAARLLHVVEIAEQARHELFEQ